MLIKGINMAIFIFFMAMYSYQIIYTIIGVFSKRKKQNEINPEKLHQFAVIIAARNEEAVIGQLIRSIKRQKYPDDLISIFVVADNCTDLTAKIAADEGAIVYERNDMTAVGKGHALHFVFKNIFKDYAHENFDGFFVFDADNLLDENYVAEMNNLFDQGYRVLTSYRNSKNYQQNWISAGYALWFLHEAEYLNNPRMILGQSCAISGTGFLIHNDIIRQNNGWKHYLLTEDIEFSVSEVINGETIGYCRNAVIYDEQPITFAQSWNQRLRWAKGFYQVFSRYGTDLLKCMFQFKKQSFSCFDMMMTIMPALLVSIASVLFNTVFLVAGLLNPLFGPQIVSLSLTSLMQYFVIYYGIIFILGAITAITEWKMIYCSTAKKILYLFTFPIFMITYIPIALVALGKRVEWKPIEHVCVKSIEDVRNY